MSQKEKSISQIVNLVNKSPHVQSRGTSNKDGEG